MENQVDITNKACFLRA